MPALKCRTRKGSVFSVCSCSLRGRRTSQHTETYFPLLKHGTGNDYVWFVFKGSRGRWTLHTKMQNNTLPLLKCRNRKGRVCFGIVCGFRGRRAPNHTGRYFPILKYRNKIGKRMFRFCGLCGRMGIAHILNILSPSKIAKQIGESSSCICVVSGAGGP